MESEVVMGEYGNYPKCPFCANEDQDWWDGNETTDDGDTDLYECGDCEKEYHVTMHIDVSFTSSKAKDCSKCNGTKKMMIGHLGEQVEVWCTRCNYTGKEAT